MMQIYGLKTFFRALIEVFWAFQVGQKKKNPKTMKNERAHGRAGGTAARARAAWGGVF